MTTYAYEWDIDGFKVVLPKSDRREVLQQFIECERGTKSGRACFYLRRADAEALFATPGDKTITVTPSTRDGANDTWQAGDLIKFKGYIACERSEVDQSGNVYVTLRDQRHKLERTSIDEPFNTVFLVALTAATGPRVLYTIYDDTTCQAANVPWEYDDILDKIFAPSAIAAPSLPFTPSAPDNIQCTGSCADVLAGILASISCDLSYDPFAGTLEIIKLSDNDPRTELTTAKNELKLIEAVERKLETKEITGEVVASPADYFPIRYVQSDTSNFGDGKKSILIIDHQLADETTKKVKAARMTAIKQAVQDWHLAELDMLDETYYGIIKRGPSEKLRSVCWLLPSNGKNHRTRFVNDVVPMPWPQRTEHIYQASLSGKTTASGLAVSTLGKVEYYKDTAATYVASGYFVEAATNASAIIGVATVHMFPTANKFLATKIC